MLKKFSSLSSFGVSCGLDRGSRGQVVSFFAVCQCVLVGEWVGVGTERNANFFFFFLGVQVVRFVGRDGADDVAVLCEAAPASRRPTAVVVSVETRVEDC